jgi:nucleotide-binding universal stress UspA family protein
MDFLMPLLTYPDASPANAITRALDFAATLDGSVTTLTHQADIPPIANSIGSMLVDYPRLAAEAEARSRAVGGELSRHVATIVNRLSVPLWQETFASHPAAAGELLAVAAQTHDMTLMPIDGEAGEQKAVAEAILFQSGGPVVLFGTHDAPVHLEVVVSAWDGHRAAARALRDALPLLEKANRVILLTVTDDKPIAEASVAAARHFLAQHGIEAVHEQIARGDREIGDALQEAALTRDAGLLVMGGYGHNRLREFVLGGATQRVLSDVRLPILMSH